MTRRACMESRHETPWRLRAARLAAAFVATRTPGLDHPRHHLGQRRTVAGVSLFPDAAGRVRPAATPAGRLVAAPARRRSVRHTVAARPAVGRAHDARLVAGATPPQWAQH